MYLSAGFEPVRENGPITVLRRSWKPGPEERDR
jgi:hypothetical protein